jgi:hypothetical protein
LPPSSPQYESVEIFLDGKSIKKVPVDIVQWQVATFKRIFTKSDSSPQFCREYKWRNKNSGPSAPNQGRKASRV